MNPRRELERLARLYDLQTSYEDVDGQRQHASDAAILGMLQCLGAPVHSTADVTDALVVRDLELWRQPCEPVLVVPEHAQLVVRLRLPVAEANQHFRARIEVEQSEGVCLDGSLSDLPVTTTHEIAGQRFVEKPLRFDCTLPCGYHSVRVDLDTIASEFLILCPPRRAWSPKARAWGVFAPLYALHSGRSQGGGDLHDLETLVDWAGSLGAAIIGTLPLLPTFLDEPFDPSPYAPVSRLFWNELYLDTDKLAATGASHMTPTQPVSSGVIDEVDELRKQPLVDYRRQMALKRHVLTELTRQFFEDGRGDRSEFEAFVEANPRLRDYARFRAATELAQQPWQQWPQRLRDGTLLSSDYREVDVRYHLYVQWRCSQQMQALGAKARSLGIGLYLDFPIGVHGAGYDVWRERDAFLQGCSLGAPPDGFFTDGQCWGIAPLDLRGLRRQKHRYFIDCIRHHMASAGALRIDHVMGLHRVYCIPEGMPAREGVYVRYRPEEFYAVLVLESVRAQTLVVGEDLGTVPDQVRESMERVGVHRMHVLQYELGGAPRDPFDKVPTEVVASVNTHDMSPFSSWWDGSEIEDRVARKLVDSVEAATRRRERGKTREMLMGRLAAGQGDGFHADDVLEVLLGILCEYAASPASVVLVTLEDLWLEGEPQNVPGTARERPNWRRKMRHSLEAIREMPEVIRVLGEIDKRMRGAQ